MTIPLIRIRLRHFTGETESIDHDEKKERKKERLREEHFVQFPERAQQAHALYKLTIRTNNSLVKHCEGDVGIRTMLDIIIIVAAISMMANQLDI